MFFSIKRSDDMPRRSNIVGRIFKGTDFEFRVGIPEAPLPPLLLIECPFCGQENTYEKKQIRVLRAPPKVTPPPR